MDYHRKKPNQHHTGLVALGELLTEKGAEVNDVGEVHENTDQPCMLQW